MLIRELDDVRILAAVTTDDGQTMPAGTEGTVVAVWHGGEAYDVEFPEPMGALATVKAVDLAHVGCSVPSPEDDRRLLPEEPGNTLVHDTQSRACAGAVTLVEDDTHGLSTEELRRLVRDGLESGPSPWETMAEVKAEARRRLEASLGKAGPDTPVYGPQGSFE
ncbi:hypothetical protein [Methylobacterium platani]|uniref:hypothetical protein n=1 Tax=Methylobacterium platani TaxID=427683 RepID=UPI000B0EBC31|nr:hypothetical protein [Methylobacterium platani]